MAKSKIAWVDCALGGVVSVLVLAAFLLNWGPTDALEMQMYDVRAGMRAQSQASSEIVIIGIDDSSLEQVGRWPWPRTYIAEMVDQLSEAGAKVIGVDVMFSNPELNPGLEEIRKMKEVFAVRAAEGRGNAGAAEFVTILQEAETRLDNDTRLTDSLALAQNAVLPMVFVPGELVGKNDREVPAEIEANFIPNVKSDGAVTPSRDFTAPYTEFGKVAKAIGHINLTPDRDDVQRAVPLVMDYNGRLFPSFGLQVLRAYYNLESNDYRYTPGKELVLGRAHIPADANGRLLVNYVGKPFETFDVVSFANVRNGKVNMESFRDKIVLIGVMSTGGGDLWTTPTGGRFPGVEIHATLINNVLTNQFMVRPEWANTVELSLMVLFALFVSFAIPNISAKKSALIAAVLILLVVGGTVYLFVSQGMFVKMMYPSLMLVAGYTVVVSKRYLVTEKRTEVLEGESVETNKMLGLSFQGQGMLDMAFEKFRKCPVDDSMKDILYNLALDFERKRQFNKAVAVFEHIIAVDKGFKDVSARADKLRIAGETVTFGNIGLKKGGVDSTVLVQSGAGDLAKPTLGRYEVTKELGKGAMGIVYLGKDPKINREVAIKTLRFEEEFDAADMKAMKERFFREAESAGRLVHPNIVTIYDAGDDGDISYIAMELLNGTDLKEFTHQGKLLPQAEVIESIAKVAEALDYAHAQGVVHRDIKPANIMRLKDGSIKVTDFGIARITSQSKTATGTVMGTPSYMSPEQLAGHKVDGRADLFSLGVTLYEMLTGHKPFTGESVATLMFRIANEPHPNIRQHKQDVPAGCEVVIDRALQKNPDNRYQRGADMARDLRALLAKAAGAGSGA